MAFDRLASATLDPIMIRQPRNLWIAGWVSLLTDLSSHMIFPLLPFYLTRVLGAGPAIVGLIEGAAETVAAMLKLYAGRWSDRIGRRKPFVVGGYALSALSKILFIPALTWMLILGARVIERIGKGIRSAPRDALIAEEAQAHEVGRAFGVQRAMDGAGGMLGAIIAWYLISRMEYREIFLWSLIPAFLAVLVALALRETGSSVALVKAVTAPAPRKQAPPLPPQVRAAVVSCALYALGHLSFVFLLLAGSAGGWSDQRTLMAYVLYLAVYTLISPLAGHASDRIGRRRMLVLGYCVFGAMAFLLPLLIGSPWLLLVFLGYGLAEAITDAVQRAWIADLAPRDQKAAAMGAYHAAIALVALPGGFAIGSLWGSFGVSAACAASLTLTSIAAVALMRIPHTAVPSAA